jgi:hypothetical protein
MRSSVTKKNPQGIISIFAIEKNTVLLATLSWELAKKNY